jgi:ATP-dependent Clp protease ATP-binding subunit ClpB
VLLGRARVGNGNEREEDRGGGGRKNMRLDAAQVASNERPRPVRATSPRQVSEKLDPNRTGREAISLEAGLKRLIVGQDEAIEQIVNIYQMYLTGLCAPGRPVGNFLFLGPTGTGKTRIVEAMAECLVRNPRAVIKVDCAEFQHSHEIAKLIGSPPGYLGHRETHPLLSQEVLNQHHTDRCKISFVLFDEIEKASDSLWNLLLGILDKATLTLGDNRKVDFSRCMIFMTSNVGASEMSSILNPKMGFSAPATQARLKSGDTGVVGDMGGKITRSGIEAARRKFPPEFVNRPDKIVVFKPLGKPELSRILDIELGMVQNRVFETSGPNAFLFNATDEAKDLLLEQGTDVKFGARPLKRAIERMLVHPMSNLIATEQIRGGDIVKIDLDDDAKQLCFTREAEGMSPFFLQQLNSQSLGALAGAVGSTISQAAAEAQGSTRTFDPKVKSK